MRRLRDRLNDAGLRGVWSVEGGHVIRLGKVRQLFFSAEPSSHVVGATAHHLLEVDEAQEVDREKFYKEFRPMGASTNVTTVLYGTPWSKNTLLEEMHEAGLELERRDGVKRHFRFDWEEVANHNPLYRQYVEAELQRLGEDHPLFRTQYRLLPLLSGGGLLSHSQRAQLQGEHGRRHVPAGGRAYVAGVDLAGEAEEAEDAALRALKPRQDSTVVTIGELDFSECDELRPEPRINVVQHGWWTGRPHHTLFPQLVDLLRNVWHCRRVVVDATGVGAGVASFLQKSMGGVVLPFLFTGRSKSELGFQLLAAVNSGRLKMYASDGSPEYQEFWSQVEGAEGRFRPNQTMEFFVDPARGHDDFLMSLALLVKASEYLPRTARGSPPD